LNYNLKLSTTIFALLSLALSIVIMGMAIGWTSHIETFISLVQQKDAKLAIGIGSVLIFLLSLYSLAAIFKKTPTPRLTVIDATELGQIHITLDAIENYVVRAATAIKGIKEVKPKIKILAEGMALLLKITLSPEVHVPDISKEIQEKVAQHLKEYAGLEVLEIEIVVDKISQSVKGRVD